MALAQRKLTLFLFVKGSGTTEIEDLVAQAQSAAALDTLERLRQVGEVERMVVATGDARFATRAEALGALAEIDPPGSDFHFGRRLATLVAKYGAAVPIYIGGGSGSLMQVQDWRQVVDQIVSAERTVITNNYFSCDFAAWTPGTALLGYEPPHLDNDLAFTLKSRAGLHVISLVKNAATQLDIDTPTDLLVLSNHTLAGTHLQDFLRSARLDGTRVRSIQELAANPEVTLLIAGRVSASMALFLERNTRCQWRIFSEERGMRASGREERGQVQSLVFSYLDRLGPRPFFDALSRLADGVVLDTRVLFAAYGLHPTASDRFHSDLLEPAAIEDRFIREFTSAARACPIPVLFGGHSLVSGGMYALVGDNSPPGFGNY